MGETTPQITPFCGQNWNSCCIIWGNQLFCFLSVLWQENGWGAQFSAEHLSVPTLQLVGSLDTVLMFLQSPGFRLWPSWPDHYLLFLTFLSCTEQANSGPEKEGCLKLHRYWKWLSLDFSSELNLLCLISTVFWPILSQKVCSRRTLFGMTDIAEVQLLFQIQMKDLMKGLMKDHF